MRVYGRYKTPIKENMKIKCPNCKTEFYKYSTNRSIQQNKYYFGVVLEVLSEDTGYHVEELHEILKALFLSRAMDIRTKKGNEKVTTVRSTADLTTVEFEEYIERIRQWASSELAIWIPEPHEQDNAVAQQTH